MLNYSAANRSALDKNLLLPRDFLTITVTNRSNNQPVTEALWSDIYDATVEIIDIDSGSTIQRTYQGAGTLVQITAIPRTSNLSVVETEISFMRVGGRAESLLLGYNPRGGTVQLHRGWLDPDTRLLVAPAEPRFYGFIDTIAMPEPAEGADGVATMRCTSHTQELTRSNPEMRSHQSQLRRSSTDNFLENAASVGKWEIFWGRVNGTLSDGG